MKKVIQKIQQEIEDCKKVIDLETSIIYDTIKDAALKNNIKYTTLFSYLSGKSKNKTKLVFYDNK